MNGQNGDEYKRRSHEREVRPYDPREARDHNSHGSDGGRAQANKYDDPPNSRLFIVCGKSITEDNFKDAFEPYGIIEEIWVLKDRVTNEPKGVTYVKFSKTSEAALAMEEMNGRCIGSHPRPLKVLIAHSRDQGSRREMNEEERLVRLFVVVPKSMGESELREHFNQFGDVDYVSIVRDRTTKESKGFAYIKYHRMSHAAKAFESCERTFKPVFADPKPQKSGYHEGGGDRIGPGPGSTTSASTTASVSAGYDMLSYMDTSHSNPEGNCRLTVISSPIINQDQLWRLFDLVPGLDYCDLKRPEGRGRDRQNKAWGTVVYNNPQSATYAKEKLHGFEYPPGHRLIIKFDEVPPPGYSIAPPSPYSMQPPPRPQTYLPPPGPGTYTALQPRLPPPGPPPHHPHGPRVPCRDDCPGHLADTGGGLRTSPHTPTCSPAQRTGRDLRPLLLLCQAAGSSAPRPHGLCGGGASIHRLHTLSAAPLRPEGRVCPVWQPDRYLPA